MQEERDDGTLGPVQVVGEEEMWDVLQDILDKPNVKTVRVWQTTRNMTTAQRRHARKVTKAKRKQSSENRRKR